MVVLRVGLILMSIFMVTVAWADGDVPRFDPNYIAFEPQVRSFEDCGVQMALDPRWPIEKTTKPRDSGGVRINYDASVGSEFWKKHDDRPIARYFIRPQLFVTVSCFPALEKTVRDFKGYVSRVRKSTKDRHAKTHFGSSFEGLKKLRGKRAKQALYYTYSSRDTEKHIDDVLRL